MLTIKQWEVWMAKVRFEDMPEEIKIRPVVITDAGEVYVIALKVTSHPPRNVWGEYPLVFWQSAGLSKPSTVRISKRLRLEERDLVRKLGRLHPMDIIAIQGIMTKEDR